jgi:hypothetical protein
MEGFYRVEVKSGQAPARTRPVGQPAASQVLAGHGVVFTGPGCRDSAVPVQPADLRGRGGNKE